MEAKSWEQWIKDVQITIPTTGSNTEMDVVTVEALRIRISEMEASGKWPNE